MSLNIAVLQNLPAMTVRFYRDSDFDHAYRVIREIGPTFLGRNYRIWDNAFIAIQGDMWVACMDEVPVAFAALAPAALYGAPLLHTDIVSPAYQRRGIGTLLTLARLAAVTDESVEQIKVRATEHSTPFYQRFGFKLDAPPQLEPVEGYHVHCLSLPYSPATSESADTLLDSLPQITFSLSFEDDPSEEEVQ